MKRLFISLRPRFSKLSEIVTYIPHHHKLYTTITNYTRPSQTIHNHHKLYLTITNYTPPSQTIHNHHKLYPTITNYTQPSQTIPNHHKLYLTITNSAKHGSPVNPKNDPALYCIVTIFCYSVREYVVIKVSEWCPTGIIEHLEKLKMASKMVAISWFQDGISHIGIFIQQSLYFFK